MQLLMPASRPVNTINAGSSEPIRQCFAHKLADASVVFRKLCKLLLEALFGRGAVCNTVIVCRSENLGVHIAIAEAHKELM